MKGCREGRKKEMRAVERKRGKERRKKVWTKGLKVEKEEEWMADSRTTDGQREKEREEGKEGRFGP